MTNSNYKLTKEDFNQINKRSLFTFQLGWNYERMQASGYLYMILPQLRKMYGDGTPELKEMMKVHTQFFNTSPFFHTIIAGFDLAMEEKDGVGSKDAVNGIKTGLMGPFAPLGDTIFGSLVPAIMGSIAATMAIAGQPWGIFLWIAVAVAYDIFRWKQLEFAYKECATHPRPGKRHSDWSATRVMVSGRAAALLEENIMNPTVCTMV